jgi:hypothetical protein
MEGLAQLENPMTSSSIERAIFRLPFLLAYFPYFEKIKGL